MSHKSVQINLYEEIYRLLDSAWHPHIIPSFFSSQNPPPKMAAHTEENIENFRKIADKPSQAKAYSFLWINRGTAMLFASENCFV